MARTRRWMVAANLCLAGFVAARTARAFETEAEARSAVERERSNQTRAERCVDESAARARDNNGEIADLNEKLNDLASSKERALLELRRGYYCSKCGRTASEIERQERTSFASHLQNVQGRPIPAPADRIEAKAAEYDRKIGSARRDVQRLLARADEIRQRVSACEADRQNALNEQHRAAAWAEILRQRDAQRQRADAMKKAWAAEESARRARAEAQRLARLRRRAELERWSAQLRQRLLDQERAAQRLYAALFRELDDRLREASGPTSGWYSTELPTPDEAASAFHEAGDLGAPPLPDTPLGVDNETDGSSMVEPRLDTSAPAFEAAERDTDRAVAEEAARDAARTLSQWVAPQDTDDASSGDADEVAGDGWSDAIRRIADRGHALQERIASMPRGLRESMVERYSDLGSRISTALDLPSEPEAIDPTDRAILSYWKVLAASLIPGRIGPIPLRSLGAGVTLYDYHRNLLDLTGRQIDDGIGASE